MNSNKRPPNLAPPLTSARNAARRLLRRPLAFFSPTARIAIFFGFLVLATTLLIVNPYTRHSGEIYKEGDISRETIVSPADIIETDERETEKWREAAAEGVRPIFTFEPTRAEQAVRSFRVAWDDLQRQQRAVAATAANGNDSLSKTENLRWSGFGGDEVARIIAARQFNQTEPEILTDVLRETAGGYIYADEDSVNLDPAEITLVERGKTMQQTVLQLPEAKMIALSIARQRLRDRIFESNNFTAPEKEVFYQALAPLIAPSVAFEENSTRQARAVAANSIPPVQIVLKRGQTVAREGDTVTPQILSQLAAIRAYTDSTRQWNRFFGLLLIIAAIFWAARKFIQYRASLTRLILSPERTFALVGLVILLQTALVAISFRLAEFSAAQNLRAPFNDPNNWALAIPFASAALIVTLLIDAHIGMIVGVVAALIAGLLAPKGVEFAVYATLSSAMAIYGFERYRSRQAVIYAGLLIGLMNAVIGASLLGYTQQPVILNTFLLVVGCGILGGIVSSAVTSVLLPVFESAFGILTDVKLLELSNADLPVLGQLALRAPGTNQHSHAVGQLAQEACRAIGANPLLARIGALYHDIGKLAAPDYFVENQHGSNPHDRLKPRQSVKIITAHVSYGEKLGKEVGLPQRIIDFILQHHGTRTLHYFLKKAQENAPEGECIDENDFRYAGPKPQSKEAAVLMIADSCEAAARSLSQPSEENVKFIVNKVVDAIVADCQLDESDLTLREVSVIRESMIKSLGAIYHARVEYPDFKPPIEQTNGAVSNLLRDVEPEKRNSSNGKSKDSSFNNGAKTDDEFLSNEKLKQD
jgi:cyclic-di-AMP phosphodiesterase PgpH